MVQSDKTRGLLDSIQADTSIPPGDLLRLAIDKGLTRAAARGIWAERRNRVELIFVEAARKNLTREGEFEIDQDAEVSVGLCPAPSGGAYVQGWVWVPLSELDFRSISLADAFELPFESVKITVEDDEPFEFSYATDIKFDDEALRLFRSGKPPSIERPIVRFSGPKSGDADLLTLDVRHFTALTSEGGGVYEGRVAGSYYVIEFC